MSELGAVIGPHAYRLTARDRTFFHPPKLEALFSLCLPYS